jgi:cytochrome oxidase Cu insertion factor (SCO1/SenC/PrrC family)
MLMPGDRSRSLTVPIVVHLFHVALGWQGAIILFLALGIGGVLLTRRLHASRPTPREVRAFTYLRWSFATLWIIDGLLQFQPAMPLGLATQVVAPSTVGVPSWVHSLVFVGVGLWNRHPLALAEATAWLEIGLGLALFASRGRTLRLVAALSSGWALLVWVLGNAFGGIFSSNASILFGWPGAVLFYVVAGLWLCVPSEPFLRHFSQWTLKGVAVILALGAVMQLLPSREFWHGGSDNALTAMTNAMAQSGQPSWLRAVVLHVGALGSDLGGGLNLIVVFWLLISAVGLWRAATRPLQWPIVLVLVGAGLVWVIAQDAAVFGGLSTDLNSMIPLAALVWCASPRRRIDDVHRRIFPEIPRFAFALSAGSVGAAMLAIATILASTAVLSDSAETTQFLAQEQSNYSLINAPAAPFTLTDQHFQKFTFPAHDHRYTVLTFLDPYCYTDCRLIAHQLEDLANVLGTTVSQVDFVVVAANPAHERVQDVRSFIKTNHMGTLTHLHFVTGSLPALENVWANYGVQVSFSVADHGMSIHSDLVYIVSPQGRERVFVPDDPAVGWAGEQSTTTALRAALHDAGLR